LTSLTEHLPAIEACPLLSLKAVYSRSKRSAETLAERVDEDIDIYFNAPCVTGHSLDDLLAREDIHAVVIALPIPVQPGIIKKAITAGKHTLSEKPIAPDVKTAIELLKWYRMKKRRELWSVGENFRFMDQLTVGADQIRKLNANVVTFSLRVYGFINDRDAYYQTAWYDYRDYPNYCKFAPLTLRTVPGVKILNIQVVHSWILVFTTLLLFAIFLLLPASRLPMFPPSLPNYSGD